LDLFIVIVDIYQRAGRLLLLQGIHKKEDRLTTVTPGDLSPPDLPHILIPSTKPVITAVSREVSIVRGNDLYAENRK